MAKEYDVVVIGTGPGGYVAAIRASQLGFKTAVVEKRDLGGVCLNIGCIPTKALLKSAETYETINHAGNYGLEVEEAKVNFPKVIKRSRGVANKMSKGVQFLMKANKIDVVRGKGKLVGNKEVQILDEENNETDRLSGKHIIIATGARSRELPNLKFDNETIINSERAMKLEEQPHRLVIVGAGAIGVEFAYFYNTIGTEVTLVELQDHIVPAEDEDIGKELAKIYKKKGMNIMTQSSVESVEKAEYGVNVKINTPNGEQTIEADMVLSAVGVVGNVEGIGLEDVGVETKKGDIIVKPNTYETNVEGIYAIGDVIGAPWLAHKASHEAIECIERIAGMDAIPANHANIPGCTYCHPEIASVGLTEKAAKEAGYEVKVGKFPFQANGKATAAGHTEGFVKVVFDSKYGEWLGCHMLGDNVTEMIASPVLARDLETTGPEVISSIHPHPTLSEAVMEAVAEAYGEGVHLGTPPANH